MGLWSRVVPGTPDLTPVALALCGPASQDTMSQNEGNSNAIVPELRGGAELPPEPQNFGPSPLFGALTHLLDCIQAERKMDRRKSMVERWFQVHDSAARAVAN